MYFYRTKKGTLRDFTAINSIFKAPFDECEHLPQSCDECEHFPHSAKNVTKNHQKSRTN